MNSVLPTLAIVLTYLAFVFFGQKWMKSKQAFELRQLMFVYNFFQVVVCAYITYEVSV